MQTIKSENLKPFTLGIADICIYPDKFNVPVKNLVKVSKGVHGTDIIELITGKEGMIGYDAAYTKNAEIDLGINTRDCIPVIFVDKEKVGVVHAGWRGLVRGIIEKMLPLFDAVSLQIYVGPFLQKFEVTKYDPCFEEIKSRFGEHFFLSTEKQDKTLFDFLEAAKTIIPKGAIWDERDLSVDLSLPSNRRGDPHGFITVVKIKT